MTHSDILNIIKELMKQQGIKSLEELGVALGVSEDKARQTKYVKAKRLLDRLSHEDLLTFAGLFGVPFEKLKAGDSSILNNSKINIAHNQVNGANGANISIVENSNRGQKSKLDKILEMTDPQAQKMALEIYKIKLEKNET